MDEIIEILQDGVAGKTPSPSGWQKLLNWELLDQQRAAAFDISPETALEEIEQRLHLLQAVIEVKTDLPLPFANQSIAETIPPLWRLWLPLAQQIVNIRRALQRPVIQGILGGQGTGKTTLAALLQVVLEQLGCSVLCLSLDDLYKTYEERCYLRQQDPRLVWRGPPGTHDVDMGIDVLEHLRQFNQPVAVPRFDKSARSGEGDRTTSELVTAIDIVLFEGWFVGVRPINSNAFLLAPPPITSEAERIFARDMNVNLQEYCKLWEMLDRLILLYPFDYRLSQQWRRQAEQQMRTQGDGMSDQQIDQFVEYFWKALHPELFIQPLLKQAEWVDSVIEVQPDHSFGAVYKPGYQAHA